MGDRGGRPASMFWLVLVFAVPVTAARARQKPPRAGVPATLTSKPADQYKDFTNPSRPGVAGHAEIRRPGVFRVEGGCDSSSRAEEFRAPQDLPLTPRFAATRLLLLALNLDAVFSEAGAGARRLRASATCGSSRRPTARQRVAVS